MVPVLATILVATPLATAPVHEVYFRERPATITDSLRPNPPRFDDRETESVVSLPPPRFVVWCSAAARPSA
jgi:hypothetical protein